MNNGQYGNYNDGYNNAGYNNGGMNYGIGGGMNNGFHQGKPDNNLIFAIISTIVATFCCCPFGLILGGISIYYASNVDNKWAMGAYNDAVKNAKTAKTLCFINIGLVVLGMIANIVSYIVFMNNPDIFSEF